MQKKEITRADIMDMDDYAKVRKERRKALIDVKKDRRVAVGPDATIYFENFDTMWHQIHEMLYIEKGGEEQISDELQAYNPMIPKGDELVATLMFEIDDEVRRDKVLRTLGGVENTIAIEFEGESVKALPEDDVERTNDDGKASSVHFLHFKFTPDQIAKFKTSDRIIVAIGHDNYGHMATISKASQCALANDFD